MSSLPTKKNLVIRRGSTFRVFARWETEPWLSVGIQSISQAVSVRIVTTVPHNLVPGWRVACAGITGPVELNARSNPPEADDFRRATVIDTTTIEFNGLNSVDWTKHKPGTGFLQWYTPHTLAGWKARMNVRDRPGGTLLTPALTSENGGLILNDSSKTIEIVRTDALTQAIVKGGVYDLEMVEDIVDGDVDAIFEGDIELFQEITTTT